MFSKVGPQARPRARLHAEAKELLVRIVSMLSKCAEGVEDDHAYVHVHEYEHVHVHGARLRRALNTP